MATQDVVTRTLVELADTLVDDFDVVDLLTLLTDRCRDAFGVSAAGLMLAAPMGGDLRVMASSSVTMRALELYEVQASEGPCLDCYRTGEPVVNEELASAMERWPYFAPVASEAGFRSVSAIPMRLRGTTIGALNLFQADSSGLSDADLSAVRAFADVATIAILQHRAVEDAHTVNAQLSHALNSRIVIEQAKGVLAERAKLDMEEAFGWLRHHARNHNLRLVDLAHDFIDGNVPLESIEPPRPPSAD
jgi:GAF domain-containing protein